MIALPFWKLIPEVFVIKYLEILKEPYRTRFLEVYKHMKDFDCYLLM